MCIVLISSLLGWKEGCIPIMWPKIFHLKGKYGGVYLGMIGLDGNNGFPLIVVYICRIEDSPILWRY